MHSTIFHAEIPIQFIIPLRELSVLETQNISLDVEVNKPGVHLSWFKDGTQITPSERIDINIEGTVHQLNIKQAVLNDEGEYMVTVGLLVSKAPVHVEGTVTYFVLPKICNLLICYYCLGAENAIFFRKVLLMVEYF
jgi:hypothetical protein